MLGSVGVLGSVLGYGSLYGLQGYYDQHLTSQVRNRSGPVQGQGRPPPAYGKLPSWTVRWPGGDQRGKGGKGWWRGRDGLVWYSPVCSTQCSPVL